MSIEQALAYLELARQELQKVAGGVVSGGSIVPPVVVVPLGLMASDVSGIALASGAEQNKGSL